MSKILSITSRCVALFPIVVVTTAWAGDVTITVPDNFKVTMGNANIAFERCLGAVVINGDKTSCTAVQNLLAQIGNLPTTPVPPKVEEKPKPEASANPTPTPSPSPSEAAVPEAQKKTEDGSASK